MTERNRIFPGNFAARLSLRGMRRRAGRSGNVLRPEVSYTEKSFMLASFAMVGGYALQPRWGDGMIQGLTPFNISAVWRKQAY